jgi:uncharacterized protein (UPF0303 family)
MEIALLESQENALLFEEFTEDTALALGLKLAELGRGLPIVINIRTPDRTLFHLALAGSKPLNDHWARRKSNTTLLFQESSLLVGTRLRAKPETLERHGCDAADYADAGGSFPIRVRGAGVVAAVTVSGLPQREDHALAVRALSALIDD